MLRRRGTDIAVWVLLLALPYWLNWVGGYTSLGSRVVILGLAAMSLNFLLGFTGVLSFGHAAYFGLGVYGVGLTIKYLVPSTLIGMAVGVIAGAIAAALIGVLIVRLRGIYFAMVTIAFGQVFYFVAYRWNSVTGGDDGLSGWHRMPIDLGFTTVDILGNDKAPLLSGSALFRRGGRHYGGAAALALWPHLARDPRERAARALSRHSRGPPHLVVLGHLVPVRQPRRHPIRAAQQFRRSA
jgi:ABC-type branched-subunit amino acid transport system permease subunit